MCPGGTWYCKIILPSVLACTTHSICWRGKTLPYTLLIQLLWLVTVFYKAEIIDSVVNSESGTRMKRGGRRSWHACRV